MKLLFILMIVIISLQSKAQLKLLNQKDFRASSFTLTDGSLKFYKSDKKSVVFYNSDLTIYKTINFPNYSFDTLKSNYFERYIVGLNISGAGNIRASDNIFNDDLKIEFIVVCVGDNEMKQRVANSYLMNEDGEILFNFPDNKESQYYLYKNGLVVTNTSTTYNYSVNGELPWPFTNAIKSAGIMSLSSTKTIDLTSFPNPNSGKSTIIYELPENSSKGNIRLYSQEGVILKNYPVSKENSELEISTIDFSSGTYFYDIEVNGISFGSKKMIVIN